MPDRLSRAPTRVSGLGAWLFVHRESLPGIAPIAPRDTWYLFAAVFVFLGCRG